MIFQITHFFSSSEKCAKHFKRNKKFFFVKTRIFKIKAVGISCRFELNQSNLTFFHSKMSTKFFPLEIFSRFFQQKTQFFHND